MNAIRFRTIWLCCVLALLPMAVLAQMEDRLVGADAVIKQADDLAAKSDLDGAINLLKIARERYPSYEPLYLDLAHWQQARSQALAAPRENDPPTMVRTPDLRDVFDTYGLATMYLPDLRETERQVDRLVAKDFPLTVGEHGPLALPGKPVAFTYTLSDPRLPAEERLTLQGLTTTQPLASSDAYRNDPKYSDNRYATDPVYGGWVFPHTLYAYTENPSDHTWRLRFRVMWQDVPGHEAERVQLAQLTSQLLVRLSGVMSAYTGLSPRFTEDGVVNVWLAENGDAGGEAYNENIYLYNIGTPRSGMEWVRELAHEFSHQTLPAVGGYTEPEWGANGRLGERLLLHWLLLNPDGANEKHPWVQEIDFHDVVDGRINTLIRQFAEQGSSSPILQGTDTAAMDMFMGMALYLEATRGSRYLTSVLTSMTTPLYSGSNGFQQSMENLELYIQSVDDAPITWRLRDLPFDIPVRVFLRDGNWSGEVLSDESVHPGNLKLNVDGKDITLNLQGKFTLSKMSLGWHVVRLNPVPGVPMPTLTALRLTRLQPPLPNI